MTLSRAAALFQGCAALFTVIAAFNAAAVSQTVNSDPEIALVQSRLEALRAAVAEVRAAQMVDWSQVPPALTETWKARLAEFESALIPRWRKVLDDPKLDQSSAEDTQTILAHLEQRLGAEEYMTFLNKCVDLRERGVIDSLTLAVLFFGDFAFRGIDEGGSVKEEFLAANYRAPQVRAFIERAAPYLEETELWPSIETLIRDILSGERNSWNWDRLDYHRPPLLNWTIWLRWRYPLAVMLIAAIVLQWRRRRHAPGANRETSALS